MRFDRFPRCPLRGMTPRRLARHAQSIKREQERVELFADQVAWETPEERIARIDTGVLAGWQRLRDSHAKGWREGRRLLRQLQAERQREILDAWNGKRWLPGSIEYFLDFLGRATAEE